MLLALNFDSRLDPITLTRSEHGLCRLQFGAADPDALAALGDDLLLLAAEQLREYLGGDRKTFTLPFDLAGLTGFQIGVLQAAQDIPYGETRTYGEIARALQKPAASRAVGGALAHNPLPILIPCHRVVGRDGSLTGYTGAHGLDTKRWLLQLEGVTVVSEKLG